MGSTIDAAQAVLTALDTSMSRQWRQEDRDWRQEDREWRSEDMAYREEERMWFREERAMREDERRWRDEDIQQRHVDNARYLWARFVEKNRRDVEEKSEQLKAISNLSALFAGFAVVNLTQFQVAIDAAPLWVIAIYGILTAVTVCLNILAMVLCTLILGCILKNGKTYVEEHREEAFMFSCHCYAYTFVPGTRPPAPSNTFDKFWEQRCEDDWRKAFSFFTWGVFSFMTSLIPISWIKFNFSTYIPATFTAIVALTILLWLWQQHNWGSYFVRSEGKGGGAGAFSGLLDLPFAWHLAPVASGLRLNSVAPSRAGDPSDDFKVYPAFPLRDSQPPEGGASNSFALPENRSLPGPMGDASRESASGLELHEVSFAQRDDQEPLAQGSPFAVADSPTRSHETLRGLQEEYDEDADLDAARQLSILS